jgi:hypothetical protein
VNPRVYLFVAGSLKTTPISSRAEVIPWTVLLAIPRSLAISLIPTPSLLVETSLRISKALLIDGAKYPLLIVHHIELLSKFTDIKRLLSTGFWPWMTVLDNVKAIVFAGPIFSLTKKALPI